jgi:hypothetical protein
MSDALDVRIEWLEAPGVTTPELAKTWARYEIWVGNRCVTQVEASPGTFRRSVYGSLYPLAEWVARNWWVLNYHIRPSAVESRYWAWGNCDIYPWLKQHNLRGAGDGMAWPDLTMVPEGAVTRLSWHPDDDYSLWPIRFASGGGILARASEVSEGLAGIVEEVLGRLAEESLPKTSLAEEWDAVARADQDEQEFCRAVARLGIDPYAVSDQTAEEVIAVASELPAELVSDFFDSADASGLHDAAEWTRRAVAGAERASGKATASLLPLFEVAAAEDLGVGRALEVGQPWTIGYAMARQVRRYLDVSELDQFDVSPWVAVGGVRGPSRGVQGIAAVREGRCGLVLGESALGGSASRFGRARALGRVLARPDQQHFVLSRAHGHDERIAGAFAAELLAPADGIRQCLDAIGSYGDAAIDAVARQFKVSSLLVQHQFNNQIARAT